MCLYIKRDENHVLRYIFNKSKKKIEKPTPKKCRNEKAEKSKPWAPWGSPMGPTDCFFLDFSCLQIFGVAFLNYFFSSCSFYWLLVIG